MAKNCGFVVCVSMTVLRQSIAQSVLNLFFFLLSRHCSRELCFAKQIVFPPTDRVTPLPLFRHRRKVFTHLCATCQAVFPPRYRTQITVVSFFDIFIFYWDALKFIMKIK